MQQYLVQPCFVFCSSSICARVSVIIFLVKPYGRHVCCSLALSSSMHVVACLGSFCFAEVPFVFVLVLSFSLSIGVVSVRVFFVCRTRKEDIQTKIFNKETFRQRSTVFVFLDNHQISIIIIVEKIIFMSMYLSTLQIINY